jgi:hypothetical protein
MLGMNLKQLIGFAYDVEGYGVSAQGTIAFEPYDVVKIPRPQPGLPQPNVGGLNRVSNILCPVRLILTPMPGPGPRLKVHRRLALGASPKKKNRRQDRQRYRSGAPSFRRKRRSKPSDGFLDRFKRTVKRFILQQRARLLDAAVR